MATPTLSHAVVLNRIADGDSPEDPNVFTLGEIATVLADSTAVSSITSQVTSAAASGALDSAPVSTADSKAVSAATQASVADSRALSASSNASTADSKALSVSVNTSIADSKAVSGAVTLEAAYAHGTSLVDVPHFPARSGEVGLVDAGWEWCDVRRYGADPSNTALVNRTAFNNALVSAAALGLGRVVVPGGVFRVDQRIVMQSHVRMEGERGPVYNDDYDGVGSCIRAAVGFSGTRIVDFTGTVGAEMVNVEIDGDGVAGPIDGIGCDAGTAHDGKLVGVRVHHCTGWGVTWTDMSHTWLMRDLDAAWNTLGGVQLINANDGAITNPRFHHNTGPGFQSDSASGWIMSNGHIEWNDGYGVQLKSGSNLNRISGTFIDRNGKAGYYEEPGSLHNRVDVTLHRNSALDLNTGDDDRSQIYLNGSSGSHYTLLLQSGNSQDDGTGVTVPRQGLVINGTGRCRIDADIRDSGTVAGSDFIASGTNTFLRYSAAAPENAGLAEWRTDSTGATVFQLGEEAAFGFAVGTTSTPSTLAAGDNNNLAIGTARRLRMAANGAGSRITGIAGGREGRELTIRNNSANTLTLGHANGGSTASNQIRSATGADVDLDQNAVAVLEYDNVSSRWDIVSVFT